MACVDANARAILRVLCVVVCVLLFASVLLSCVVENNDAMLLFFYKL